jgi:very-short-patch-repair endonuclease
LRDLPVKFTRQKPLGRYIADFYCASRLLASWMETATATSADSAMTREGRLSLPASEFAYSG